MEDLIEEAYEIHHYEFFEREEDKMMALKSIEDRIIKLREEAAEMSNAREAFKKYLCSMPFEDYL